MTEADVPTGVVSFTYNADGQRVAKSTTAGEVGYVYDGANLLLETEGLGGDTDVAYNTTINDEFGNLLSENRGAPAETYPMCDGQWSAQALMDPDGQVQGPLMYRAFGLTAFGPEAWETFTAGQWSGMTPDDWSSLPAQPLPTNMGAWGQKQYYLDPETQLLPAIAIVPILLLWNGSRFTGRPGSDDNLLDIVHTESLMDVGTSGGFQLTIVTPVSRPLNIPAVPASI